MRYVSFVDLDKALNFDLLINDEAFIFHLFSRKMFIYHLFFEYVPLKEPAPIELLKNQNENEMRNDHPFWITYLQNFYEILALLIPKS